MTKYERMAARLFKARWFPDTEHDVSLRHFEREDILVLVDRRTCERRDREWCGFRNYLYGYDCGILAEHAAPGYAVMLIDASQDLQGRLAREFCILTMTPASIDDFGNADEIRSDPQHLAVAERHCRPELHHNIWGRVAVENGKPIGLYVDGEVVCQPINKPWHEYSSKAAA